MLQVEDTSQQSRQKETTSPVPRPPEKPKDETRRGRGRKTRNIPDKYKGFEALLDDSIEADDEAQQLKQGKYDRYQSDCESFSKRCKKFCSHMAYNIEYATLQGLCNKELHERNLVT